MDIIEELDMYITIHMITLINIISNNENININSLIPYIFNPNVNSI